MAKPTIVTRASKGSALTWTEGDTNLENLRDATIGITDGTTSGTLDLNDTLTFTAGSNVTLSYNSTSKALTINASGGSGITEVVQDTTPQLGGDLDVNGKSIVSVSNGAIVLAPNGSGDIFLGVTSGKIYLKTDIWPTTAGTSGQVLSTDGAGNLSWINAGGGTPTQVDFQATPSSTDVYFTMTSATGAGAKNLYAPNVGGLKYNTGTGQITTDVNLNLNGSNLMVRMGGNISLYDNDDSNRSIVAPPSNLTANTLFRLPDSNGTSGQFLKTDGSGNTSWATGGTVSSVGGTGTVNGLTLTGTVTTSGNLTLGGTLDLSSPPAIGGTTANTGRFSTLTTTAQGELRLSDADSSNYVGFKSPATVTANKVWVLPAADGTANQVLKTDGSGNLGWATAGGGGNSYAVLESTSNNLTCAANSTSTLNPTWVEAYDPQSIVTSTATQFTLAAGSYLISFSSAGMLASGTVPGVGKNNTGGIYFEIYSVTASAVQHRYYQEGTSFWAGNVSTYEIGSGPVNFQGVVSPSVSTTYEIRFNNSGYEKQFNNYSSPGKAFRIVITKLS